MNANQAIETMRGVIRLKHFALSTERCYVDWARRYAAWLLCREAGQSAAPADKSRAGSSQQRDKLLLSMTSEQKFAAWLTHLARDLDVSAVTQNQAFNADLCRATNPLDTLVTA